MEEQVLPDNRSFLDIVNGVPAPSASAPAFAFPLPWLVTVCAALVALCAAVYGTIGYVQDKPVAGAERQMPEHAAGAAGLPQRADLPQSQDRPREELPGAAAGPDTTADARPPLLASARPRGMLILFLCAVAFLAGLIDAIAGGGGLLTVPALMVVVARRMRTRNASFFSIRSQSRKRFSKISSRNSTRPCSARMTGKLRS